MNFWSLAADYTNGIRILRDWLGEGGISVSPEQAQARANICLKCPANFTGGPLTITESVANAIKEAIEFKNALKLRVDGEKSLHRCMQCSCALKLKVHVPIDFIRKHQGLNEFYPDHCWIKTEP